MNARLEAARQTGTSKVCIVCLGVTHSPWTVLGHGRGRGCPMTDWCPGGDFEAHHHLKAWKWFAAPQLLFCPKCGGQRKRWGTVRCGKCRTPLVHAGDVPWTDEVRAMMLPWRVELLGGVVGPKRERARQGMAEVEAKMRAGEWLEREGQRRLL